MKETCEICSKVLSDNLFVFCQQLAEGGECVGADFEGAFVDPIEEFPEDTLAGLWDVWTNSRQPAGLGTVVANVVVQDNGGCGVGFENFAEDGASGDGGFFMIVGIA